MISRLLLISQLSLIYVTIFVEAQDCNSCPYASPLAYRQASAVFPLPSERYVFGRPQQPYHAETYRQQILVQQPSMYMSQGYVVPQLYVTPPQPAYITPPPIYATPPPVYATPPPTYPTPPPTYPTPPPTYPTPPPTYPTPPPTTTPPPPKCFINQYGYKCCSVAMMSAMTQIMNNPSHRQKWKNCNMMKQATDMKNEMEAMFGRSFESVISPSEIVSKSRWIGEFMCKSRSPDGKVILLYAPPSQYTVGPGPARPLTEEEILAKGWSEKDREVSEI